MKNLMKRLCSALIVSIVMQVGLEAAPHEASSTPRKASTSSTENHQVDEAQSKTIHTLHPPAQHINDLKGPGYDVHIHDYHPPPPPEYTLSLVEILKYLDKTFHFIDIVDKNDLLATDMVDTSWYQWLDYMHQIWPFINYKIVDANDIENPQHDTSWSFWDSLLYMLLKRNNVRKVDNTDDNKQNKIDVHYTTIQFDPVGQLFLKGWDIIKAYSGYDSLSSWWKSVESAYQKYSAFKYDKVTQEEVLTDEVKDGVHHPEGVLSISPYDPVVLGVNTMLFIGWHILFWASYIPISGVENLFADYPDIDPDNPEGEDYPADAADYPEDYPEDYPDDYPEGGDGGDGGDAGRRDYYNPHGYYDAYSDYTNYHYYNGESRLNARSHKPKDSLSSNYYSHGAIPPHEAYTLSDTNIFVKK